MLSAKLKNGTSLTAIDLGQEIHLKMTQKSKRKTTKESWKFVEKNSPTQSFEEAANQAFISVAQQENSSIIEPKY